MAPTVVRRAAPSHHLATLLRRTLKIILFILDLKFIETYADVCKNVPLQSHDNIKNVYLDQFFELGVCQILSMYAFNVYKIE